MINETHVTNNCENLTFFQNKEYDHPFISMMIPNDEQYIKFCENFDHYISLLPVFGEPKRDSVWAQQNNGDPWYRNPEISVPYPVMFLDDIEFHWIHEHSIPELLEKFERRKIRYLLRKPKVWFCWSIFDVYNDHDEDKFNGLLNRFMNLPLSIFLTRDESDLELNKGKDITKNAIFLVKRWMGTDNSRHPLNYLYYLPNNSGKRINEYKSSYEYMLQQREKIDRI